MKNPFRHLVVVTLTWIVGLAAGVVLLYTIGAQGQCAADIACGQQAERWWHTPLLLLVGLGPGIIATIALLRSDDAAV